MATIARLKDSEISNGNVINADDIDAELNQLVNESNSKETRITDLESSDMSITGIKTFGSIPLLPASDPTTDNQAARKAYVDTVASPLTTGLQKYMQGCVPAYASSNTVTIGTGIARDSTNAYNLSVSSPLTVSLAASGALGLDNGSETSSTWYYLYLIGKTDGTVSSVFSTINESVSGSITLPSGYTLKRQLSIAVRNDGSSNIIPFMVGDGWPYRPTILYTDFDTANAGTYQVLNGQHNTTAFTAGGGGTAVTMTGLIPPISKLALLTSFISYSSGSAANAWVRSSDGQSTTGIQVGYASSAAAAAFNNGIPVNLGSSQGLVYRTSANTSDLSLWVQGYTVTEM